MRTKCRSVGVVTGLVSLSCWLALRSASAAWPLCGSAIATAPDAQAHSTIVADGAGGAIIAWRDHRSKKINVFAQHVLASGDIDAAWPFNGRAMMSDTSLAGAAGGQFLPAMVSDGAGGAIVAWIDLRDVESDKLDIVAQHVLSSGAVDSRYRVDGCSNLRHGPYLRSSRARMGNG